MTELPERIWVVPHHEGWRESGEWKSFQLPPSHGGPQTEYIRADLVASPAGWVPVSERLPEAGDGSGIHDEIVIGNKDMIRTISVWAFLTELSNPKGWAREYTHWMPLSPIPGEN